MSTDPSDVYAVIRSGGKQYRVSPGQRLKLERLDGAAGDRITFSDVLLVSGGGEVAVGAPTVDSASVSGEIVEQGRGRKINVFKYKNKTRYRRLRGHRQLHTAVLVDEVSLGDQTWTAPVADEPTEAEIEEVEAVEDEAAIDEPVAEATDETADEPDEASAEDTADDSGEDTEE
ncbi:MAG: 50S ribosomal protein L21 [Chloroflexota bacterium]|nr:50S ribosomal protein L21 [Chloroflexota bacterium]